MIIKVQGVGARGEEWCLIDKVDEVLQSRKVELTSAALKQEVDQATHAFLTNPPVEGKESTHQVGIIRAKRADGSERHVVFDTVAYICNDQGNTIERVRSR